MSLVLAVGFLWAASFQAAPQAVAPAAFVEDVVRSLRDVRDTADARAVTRTSSRQKAVVSALALHQSGDAIALRMERWRRDRDPRIRDVASYLNRSAQSLEVMAGALDDVVKGDGDVDVLFARFKGDGETLGVMMLSVASLAANPESAIALHLAPADRGAIVKLIEDVLFSDEVKAYASAIAQRDERYVLEPEVFAVLSFLNMYRDGASDAVRK